MKKNNRQKGIALITLLVFSVISLTITSAAIIIIVNNASASTTLHVGNRAYSIAESGVENALLRLLRDPNYSGETMTIDEGSATISVSGSGPLVVSSTGTLYDYSRTIEVTVDYTGNILSILSWKEIF